MMKKLTTCIALLGMFACTNAEVKTEEKDKKETKEIKKEPHKYGGWYCPDNLNGFPPVNSKDWTNVPVIEGRLPTKEETKTEASLLFIDTEKYPNARTLEIDLPQLATYYNEYSKKEEIVIVIQAVVVENDSVVGFRYMNGGNGSAWLKDVDFYTKEESNAIESSKFVTIDIDINTSQDEIWKVLTNKENAETLQPLFDKQNNLKKSWRKKTNMNYFYPNSGMLTSAFADKLYGSYYIQNNYINNGFSYVEKLLLLEDNEDSTTKLKVVFGPFKDNYQSQKSTIEDWGKKIKELSER